MEPLLPPANTLSLKFLSLVILTASSMTTPLIQPEVHQRPPRLKVLMQKVRTALISNDDDCRTQNPAEFEMDEDPEAAFEEEEPAGGSYYSEDYDEAYQADEDDDIPQPAPGGGRKRGRSLSTQVLDYTRAPVPRRENGHTGRPRRKDYDEESRTTIAGAQARFGCFLVTENAFPDRATEIEQSVSCWDDECRESGVLLRITPEIIKMVCFPYLNLLSSDSPLSDHSRRISSSWRDQDQSPPSRLLHLRL